MRVMELDCVDFSLMLLLPACMHRTANTGICAISVRFNAMRLTQLLGMAYIGGYAAVAAATTATAAAVVLNRAQW